MLQNKICQQLLYREKAKIYHCIYHGENYTRAEEIFRLIFAALATGKNF